MAEKPKTKIVSTKPTGSFHYKFGSVATMMIILGLVFNFGILFILGFIVALIWAYRYQKANPKYRWMWIIAVLLLLIPIILFAIKDTSKFM